MGTLAGAFETRELAARAVDDIMAGGIEPGQISVVGRHGEAKDLTPEHEGLDRAAAGAGIGATVGGLGALLVGAAALAVPGVGPILALGPLSAALTTAVAGGIAGGLIGFFTAHGMSEGDAAHYAERVHAGAYVVVVHARPDQDERAELLLAEAGAEAPIRHQ